MALERIKQLCADKHIVLVGNSIAALSKKQGKDIDSFDIVVRFGKGVPDSYPEYLGTRTDIWCTGNFRSEMRGYFPDKAEVLYNVASLTNVDRPSYYHTVMFDKKEIEDIQNKYITEYDIKGNKKRLSIGVMTALFFVNKVKTFSSLSFINFDFFQKSVKMFTDSEMSVTSWHLPIINKKFVKDNNNPAHEIEAEKKVVLELLENDKVFFIGDVNTSKEIISQPNAPWTSYRKPV